MEDAGMPELGSIHDDVRFDWGAASQLATELRSTAGELDRQVGDRDRIRGPARARWRGRYGDEFDGRVRVCTADAGRFAGSMREAASRLDEMARLAREEQARREQAHEWVRHHHDGGFLDGMHDFFMGEDDVPPPPPPVQPPSIPVQAPAAASRGV
jgi:uncharacterized protein YukE